jgi:hypothetical protein
MNSFPLIHILFWIAVNLAPQNASQIVIAAPDPYENWTWTRQESNWIHSVERSVWAAEGSTVTSKSFGGTDKQDVGPFVKGIKEQDWDKSPSFKLRPMISLIKKGDTFVCALNKGDPAEMRFVIEFKK